MHCPRIPLLPLLLLVACTGEPEVLGDCKDAACREQLVRATFARDPEAGAAMVAGIEEPVERLVVVMALVEAHPGQTQALCQQLPKGASRSRCVDLNQRPHLWAEPAEPAVSGARAASGPPARDVLPAKATSAFEGVAAADAGCPPDADTNACIAKKARLAAAEGRALNAAALCQGMEGDEKWRQECAFAAAEVSVGRRGIDAYDEAAELCLLSGPFASNCLSHLLMGLHPDPPDPASADPAAWQAITADIATIEAFWQKRDPDFAPIALDRAWSEVLAGAYEEAGAVNARPLDHLPPAAAPHLRAALAHRLVQLEQDEGHDLTTWQARLGERLAEREALKVFTKGPPKSEFIADLWPQDQPGEAARPAVFHLRTSRRTVHEDADLDGLICLLEALARVQPEGWRGLLQEATTHTDEAIAWTAGRLLEQREDPAQHRPDMQVQGMEAAPPPTPR